MRKPLSEAKQLLAAAGYPNGRDPRTGQALLLNYDLRPVAAAQMKMPNIIGFENNLPN